MTDPDKQNLPTVRAILRRSHLRLMLVAVVLAATCLSVSGLLLQRGAEIQNLRLAARSIVFAAEPAVVFGDAEAASEAVASVAGVETVDSVRIVKADGTVLADWVRDEGERSALRELGNSIFWRQPRTEPMLRDGEEIATVIVTGNSAGILRYIGLSALALLIFIGIALLALRILWRQLQDMIVVPLEEVAQVTDEVRVERDFTRRVVPSGVAEVDRLARGVNDMLSDLERWYDTLKDEKRELAYRSEHDVLTGLGNRMRFNRLLEEALQEPAEGSGSFALLFIDLNRFKAINDEFGHQVGDLVLCEFAKRLQETVRSRDQIFRLGGDEFAVVLDPSRERFHPPQLAARIEAALLPPLVLESGKRVGISASIGFANYPEDGTCMEDLVRHADEKMYQEKRKGTSDGN